MQPSGRPQFDALEPRVLFAADPAAIDPPAVGDASNTSDFDGDGNNDLVFRQGVHARTWVHLLDGAGAPTGEVIPLTPRFGSNTNWRVLAVADFDGDADPDLFFRNVATGKNTLWLMNGAARQRTVALPNTPDVWRFGGAGDFTGDGTADLFLRNGSTGQNVVWNIESGAFVSAIGTQPLRNQDWQPVGVDDFDADGDADVLYQNRVTRQNVAWYFDGTTYSTSANVPTLADEAWQVGEVKDFDGDGGADLVWRHQSNGRNALWFMSQDGTVRESSALVQGFADASWRLPGQSLAVVPVDALLGVEPLVELPHV